MRKLKYSHRWAKRIFASCLAALCLASSAPVAFAATSNPAITAIIMFLLDDDAPAPAPKSDAIGHWKLDETSGATATDASGNQQHGSVTGGSWVAGHLGGALHLNGVNDYLKLPYQTLNGRGDVTISLWFRTADAGDQTLLSGAERNNSNVSRIFLRSGNRISYYASDRSWERETWTVPAFADNAWHQLVIVRDDSFNRATLYLDGVSYGVKYPGVDLLKVEQNGLILAQEQGRVGGSFNAAESFTGDLDDIRFTARALSRDEVELAFENANWGHAESQIDRSSDDAEGSGNPNLTSTTLDLLQNAVGLRFNQVGIPVGATIEKAYVEFRSRSTLSAAITVPIHGELNTHPATFSNTDTIASRAHTSASVSWQPDSWSWREVYRTPDISPVVQEIVNQNGWQSGNSLALLFDQGAGGRRGAFSWDSEPQNAARLVVYYSGGTPDATPPSTPANVSATPLGGAVSLHWDKASDAESGVSHYELRRQTNGGPAQVIARIEASPFAPGFTDSNVAAGNSYHYTVTAVNNAGLPGAASSAVTASPLDESASGVYWALDDGAGSIASDSGSLGLDGTLVDNPTWDVNGRKAGALAFNGTTQQVLLPVNALDGARSASISLWFKTAVNSRQTLFSGASPQFYNALLLALLNNSSVYFRLNNDTLNWTIDPVDDNQWHHILINIDGDNNAVALYLDGLFQSSQRITVDAISLAGGSLVLAQELANASGSIQAGRGFNGLLDEVRIERTLAGWLDIQQQATLDGTPPTAPSGLAASSGDGAIVQLSWNAASDAETGICKYRIYRGASAGAETFLFETGNVTQAVDADAANGEHYSYRVSAENCVGLEGAKTASAEIDAGSDSAIGFTTISSAAWDDTAIRKVLRVFAYGGHASDAQIATWAAMPPKAAIAEILTFDKVNSKLSPPEDASSQHMDGLLALQNFWGGNSADNPMLWDRRAGYAPTSVSSSGSTYVSYENLQRVWSQAIVTRGGNPFLQKMAFYLTNYQISISQFKARTPLIRDYYDTILNALNTKTSIVDVIKTAAKHAAVAYAYDHDDNTFDNATLQFRGNDDFAREFFQLAFGIQGETEDPDYHEDVTIENNAMLLSGMKLDQQTGAWGSQSTGDRYIAPIDFSDHIDPNGNYVYNQSLHHADCLEILHQTICGATASAKIDALAPYAANHPESLDNMPLLIVNFFADDNLTAAKKTAIRAAWRESHFNLLQFLRDYAVSTAFHSADTYKYMSSFDRNLSLFNLITLNNEETFKGLTSGENTEDWLDYLNLNVFNPVHDVFGHQTGLEAINNPNVFKRNYDFEIERNTLQRTRRLYYLDETEIDATTWYKNWGAVIPASAGGAYVVADVADWLWKRLAGDGGKNFDILAKAQVYALLARGDDFGLVAFNDGIWQDRNHAFTSAELNAPGALKTLVATLGAETMKLADPDIKGARRTANSRVAEAVQFIAMLPYTFVVEGQ